MKKLLLIATIGIAGCLSANDSVNKCNKEKMKEKEREYCD